MIRNIVKEIVKGALWTVFMTTVLWCLLDNLSWLNGAVWVALGYGSTRVINVVISKACAKWKPSTTKSWATRIVNLLVSLLLLGAGFFFFAVMVYVSGVLFKVLGCLLGLYFSLCGIDMLRIVPFIAGVCTKIVKKRDRKRFERTLVLAQAGDVKSQVQVGQYYDDGMGTQPDREKAKYWFMQAVKQGSVAGMRHMGAWHGFWNKKPSTAWYRKAAEAGDAVAQCALGNRHFFICGDETSWRVEDLSPQQTEEGLKWYLQSAAQGYVEAQLNLGYWFMGHDNPQQALVWFRKGAKLGNAAAMYAAGLACAAMGKRHQADSWVRKAFFRSFHTAYVWRLPLWRGWNVWDTALNCLTRIGMIVGIVVMGLLFCVFEALMQTEEET